eukprot:g15569.t1
MNKKKRRRTDYVVMSSSPPRDAVMVVLSFLEHRYLFALLRVFSTGLWGHNLLRWPARLELPCFPPAAGLATLVRHGSTLDPITLDPALAGDTSLTSVVRHFPLTTSLRILNWKNITSAPARPLPELRTLTLDCCDLRSAPLLAIFGPLLHLQTLRLHWCRGINNLCFLARLPSLTRLDLSGSFFVQTEYLRFATLARNLTEFWAPDGWRPDVCLGGLRGLRALHLPLSRTIDHHSLIHLRRLRGLQELSLLYRAAAPWELGRLLVFVKDLRLRRLTLEMARPCRAWLEVDARLWRGCALEELVIVNAELPSLEPPACLPELRSLELMSVSLQSLAGWPDRLVRVTDNRATSAPLDAERRTSFLGAPNSLHTAANGPASRRLRTAPSTDRDREVNEPAVVGPGLSLWKLSAAFHSLTAVVHACQLLLLCVDNSWAKNCQSLVYELFSSPLNFFVSLKLPVNLTTNAWTPQIPAHLLMSAAQVCWVL